MKVTSLRYLDAKFHHPSPKIKKIPKNTNGRLAIPALAGLLVCIASIWRIKLYIYNLRLGGGNNNNIIAIAHATRRRILNPEHSDNARAVSTVPRSYLVAYRRSVSCLSLCNTCSTVKLTCTFVRLIVPFRRGNYH